MKLQNKKTGEIGKPRIQYQEIYIDTENHMTYCYKTLQGMFEEWEDYEELKHHYYIDYDGDIMIVEALDYEPKIKEMKQIGNYFETREEAERAVKKLNAFKRLQDLGFRFEGVRFRNNHSYIEWKIQPKNELTDDEVGILMEYLYEVFGGKDESKE